MKKSYFCTRKQSYKPKEKGANYAIILQQSAKGIILKRKKFGIHAHDFKKS